MSQPTHSPEGLAELRGVIRSARGAGPVLRIALVQPRPGNGPAETLGEGEAYCRQARDAGAHLVLFPEMYSVGYRTAVDFGKPAEVAKWEASATAVDGPFISRFRELARELGLAIVMGHLEKRGDGCRNAATVIDCRGHEVFTYAKVHTLRFFPMESRLTPGDCFPVEEVDTSIGAVRLGAMICYDREFPESARVLALKGAELIVTPNACALNELRLGQFRSRAWENAVATAMASYATGQGDGHSCVYQADGREVLVAGSETGLFCADLDLGELRAIQRHTYWGKSWRRPEVYGSYEARPDAPRPEWPAE